jgi:pimeloyl-ACP methyl ester carboxylesterase
LSTWRAGLRTPQAGPTWPDCSASPPSVSATSAELTRSSPRRSFAFANAVSEEESNELYERWTIPAPGRPLFEAAAANFNPHSPAKVDTENQNRGPLLLIASGKDNTVPESVTRSTLKQYRHSSAVTDIRTFEDRGHSLIIDSGWREIADISLAWLKDHAL